MNFGENLQRLRRRAGLSQSELANQAGIPVKTIQNWEISRRAPRWISLLAKLARGLGVPMEALAVESDVSKEMEAAPKKVKGRSRPAGELEATEKKLRSRSRKGK